MQQEIDTLYTQLQAHRRLLRMLLEQLATHGSDTRPAVKIDIDDARAAIYRIKQVLRRDYALQVNDEWIDSNTTSIHDIENGYWRPVKELLDIFAQVDWPTITLEQAFYASCMDAWLDRDRSYVHMIQYLWPLPLQYLPGALCNGQRPLFVFVAHLALSSAGIPIRQLLFTWMERHAQSFNLTVGTIGTLLRRIEAIASAATPVRYFLQIVLRPLGVDAGRQGERRYQAYAWLIKQEAPAGDVVDVDIINLTETIDQHQTASLHSLRHCISNLVRDSLAHHPEAFDTLTVEFYLPREHLYADVDQWTILDLEDLPVPLGAVHPVVVRSLKLAHSDPIRRKMLHQKWQSIIASWSRAKVFLCSTEECDDRLHIKLSNRTRLMVIFTLALAPNNITSVDIFRYLDGAAIPIALWPRRPLSEDEIVELQDLVPETEITELLSRLQEKRREAAEYADDMLLFKHLSLLWNDPDRQPLDRLFEQSLRAPIFADEEKL